MTEEDQDFLLDNIRELHYPAGAPYSQKNASVWELFSSEGRSPRVPSVLSGKRSHTVPFKGQ